MSIKPTLRRKIVIPHALMNRKFSEEAASWMQEQRAAYIKILSN
ncbi:hypothetical protein ACLK1S_00335 [Escherichia coli]